MRDGSDDRGTAGGHHPRQPNANALPDHPAGAAGTQVPGAESSSASHHEPVAHGPGRRSLIRGLAAAGIGSVAFLAGRATVGEALVSPEHSAAAEPVPSKGPHQAGIDRPATPQPHGLIAVLDLPDGTDDVAGMCAALGAAITALTTTGDDLLDGPGDLSLTLGLGPRLVASIDDSLPGARELPAFSGDEDIFEAHVGGDLLLAGYGSDPNVVDQAVEHLITRIPGATRRWSQRVFRAPGQGTIVRNPLGFHDGVIVPRGEEALAEHVWIDDGPLAGGTICVLRRLRLDIGEFCAKSLATQEQIMGRRRGDGSPLSGGGPTDEADLLARSPTGEFLTPARSHVRAAHPSFTGSQLMLRRGYAYDNGHTDEGTRDAGLMFICFQRDLKTFTRTQHRLDESDDLMAYVRTTATGTFLILPGYDDNQPLGDPLR